MSSTHFVSGAHHRNADADATKQGRSNLVLARQVHSKQDRKDWCQHVATMTVVQQLQRKSSFRSTSLATAAVHNALVAVIDGCSSITTTSLQQLAVKNRDQLHQDICRALLRVLHVGSNDGEYFVATTKQKKVKKQLPSPIMLQQRAVSRHLMNIGETTGKQMSRFIQKEARYLCVQADETTTMDQEQPLAVCCTAVGRVRSTQAGYIKFCVNVLPAARTDGAYLASLVRKAFSTIDVDLIQLQRVGEILCQLY